MEEDWREEREICSIFRGEGWREGTALLEAGYKGMYVALRILRDNGGEMLAGILAKEMHITTARMAVLLKTLLKKGYIDREPLRTDGRRVLIRLTPVGAEALKKREEEVYAFLRKGLSKLTDKEKEYFVCIMRKLFSVGEG